MSHPLSATLITCKQPMKKPNPSEIQSLLFEFTQNHAHWLTMPKPIQLNQKTKQWIQQVIWLSRFRDLLHSGFDIFGISRGHCLHSNWMFTAHAHITNMHRPGFAPHRHVNRLTVLLPRDWFHTRTHLSIITRNSSHICLHIQHMYKKQWSPNGAKAGATTSHGWCCTNYRKLRFLYQTRNSPSSWLPSDAGSISTSSDAALRTHGKRRNFCRNRSGTRITIRLSTPAPTNDEWRRHSGNASTFFFRLPKHAGAFIITACPIVILAAITSKVQTSLSLSLCLSLSLSLRKAQNKRKQNYLWNQTLRRILLKKTQNRDMAKRRETNSRTISSKRWYKQAQISRASDRASKRH